MASKLTKLTAELSASGIQQRTKQSTQWLLQKIADIRNPSQIARGIKDEDERETNRFKLGGLYCFYYDPLGKDDLPYYDKLTNKLSFIVWNIEQDEKSIDVQIIYNDVTIIDFGLVKPKHWFVKDIDDFYNAKKLVVILNKEVRNIYDFTKNKEEFKQISFREEFNR